ncbi:DUF397 domain-containing protein [Streptomyces antarcticus]|uniref:DUF397 domain-containing protein n=1 Tax=Streptomyces antarcticus TaxID=2996458 RepID=UPI0022718BCD|nr:MULTISPECIES: DUF397 domain-containing protein [unclassified Streptomyces]MCY0942619.1 DUF397 domain-containing protein [Streptomyces sp. H34-AA3]MCZ4081365.1 DUF397 domain-containing protein [Streptomyces sp. H34-S5]
MTHADIPEQSWTSSSFSQSNGGECIEWAPDFATAHAVPIRDSKNKRGPVVTVTPKAWAAFVGFAAESRV